MDGDAPKGRRTRGAKRASAAASDELPAKPPNDSAELHAWLGRAMQVHVSRTPMVPGHSAPMDYLDHVFFERGSHAADCLVWANRGGGKTYLGAVATVLDLVFKPGVQVRILGGSLEQSQRMYEHLRLLFESPVLAGLVKGRPTVRRLALTNGAAVQVLSASQTAVRGTRVQKVRCDEVDLFDQEMWDAVQLTTRSLRGPGPWGDIVKGSVEALSTMHRPFGLMQRLVDQAQRPGEGGSDAQPRRVFKWGVLDVLERCTDEHACDTCTLYPECRGRAKEDGRRGHIRVSDAVAMKPRVGRHTWESEMLCLMPKRSDCVYPEFDLKAHALDDAQVAAAGPFSRLIAGLDFGYRSESALLLGGLDACGRLVILREHVRTQTTVAELAGTLRAWSDELGPAAGQPVSMLAIDPAGLAASDQTGRSAADVLKEAGFAVRAKASTIHEGVNLVRARLAPAATRPGEPATPRLLVHRGCTRLLECLAQYHYPVDDPESLVPVKDGSDHACDALRYLVLHLDSHAGAVRVREY